MGKFHCTVNNVTCTNNPSIRITKGNDVGSNSATIGFNIALNNRIEDVQIALVGMFDLFSKLSFHGGSINLAKDKIYIELGDGIREISSNTVFPVNGKPHKPIFLVTTCVTREKETVPFTLTSDELESIVSAIMKALE